MSMNQQLLIEGVLAVATIALPASKEPSASGTPDQIYSPTTQVSQLPLLEAPAAALVNQMPESLQPAASPSVDERIAYWGPYRGWYGPAYRYGYWGAPPRYYYRGGPAYYNSYYGGYPDYYGPRVGVRVYPYGGYWGRYYW
jgi:hypothetical protein